MCTASCTVPTAAYSTSTSWPVTNKVSAVQVVQQYLLRYSRSRRPPPLVVLVSPLQLVSPTATQIIPDPRRLIGAASSILPPNQVLAAIPGGVSQPLDFTSLSVPCCLSSVCLSACLPVPGCCPIYCRDIHTYLHSIQPTGTHLTIDSPDCQPQTVPTKVTVTVDNKQLTSSTLAVEAQPFDLTLLSLETGCCRLCCALSHPIT